MATHRSTTQVLNSTQQFTCSAYLRCSYFSWCVLAFPEPEIRLNWEHSAVDQCVASSVSVNITTPCSHCLSLSSTVALCSVPRPVSISPSPSASYRTASDAFAANTLEIWEKVNLSQSKVECQLDFFLLSPLLWVLPVQPVMHGIWVHTLEWHASFSRL